MHLKNEEKEYIPIKSSLFRCIYIDPETNKVVSLGQKEKCVFDRNGQSEDYEAYKENIDQIQQNIFEKLEQLKRYIESRKLDYNVCYKLLLKLRYLVKHAAFKEEQECRIIQIAEYDDKKTVKPDKDVDNRLYIDYVLLNKDNTEKICFAPKAKDISKFKQQLALNGFSGIECYQSKAPLA